MTAVRAEADGAVLVVTIDRPQARNAVNLAVAEGIVAARDARFGIPEVKRGLVAAGGALIRLPRRVALELALTGDPIGAERAYEMGLISRVVEPGEALAAALELARTIAANGPLAVDATKRILMADEDWERQAAIAAPVFASEDAREGARAFAEKRAPEWRGR